MRLRAVVIDDVVTTGRTIHEAMVAMHDREIRVVTATSADTMDTRADAFQTLGGGVAHERAITALHRAGHLHSAPDRGREPVGFTALDKPRRKDEPGQEGPDDEHGVASE